MSTPALVGSCGCGAVRFEVTEPLRPLARQYVAYHPAWAPIPDDGLPRFDEAMPRPPA